MSSFVKKCSSKYVSVSLLMNSSCEVNIMLYLHFFPCNCYHYVIILLVSIPTLNVSISDLSHLMDSPVLMLMYQQLLNLG